MDHQQISNLEERMQVLEKKVDNTLDVLGEMNEELKKLNRGIYGDKDNKTPGLIERQEADEKKLEDLEKRVFGIEENNKKGNIKKDIVDSFAQKSIKIFGIIMMIYLLLKDVVGVDTLIELILGK